MRTKQLRPALLSFKSEVWTHFRFYPKIEPNDLNMTQSSGQVAKEGTSIALIITKFAVS